MARFHTVIDCVTGEQTDVPFTAEEEAAADALAAAPPPTPEPADDPVAVLQRQNALLLAALAKADTLAKVRAAAQQAAGG
jgi:hypothetical protein